MNLDHQTIKQKSISGVVSYAARTGFLYLISIVATGLLSVYLTPADFGIYFVVTAVIGVFTFMSDIGLAATLVQKKELPSVKELRTTFTVQQLLALAILLITLICTPLWKTSLGLSHDGILLLYVLSFSFLLASWKTIPSILLERDMEFGKIVIPQIVENILFYGIAVYCAHLGWGVKSYTYAVLCRSIGGVVVMYVLKQWPIGLCFSKEVFKSLISFGAKFQLNDLLARIKDDLFVAVLAKFLPAYQMGLIGWAKKWSMFPYQFSVNSVVSIAFPTFSRLQDDKTTLGHALEKTLFFISLAIFPLLTGLIIMAYPITILIPQYQKWQPALPSLAFFCLNIAFAALANPIINTLNAIGEINRTLKLMIIMTMATWGLTPLCIHWLGPVGVSMAAALVAGISLLIVFEAKKLVPLRFIESIWRQLIATGVMAGCLLYTEQYWLHSWRGVLTAVAVGGGIYVFILFVVGYKKIVFETRNLLSRTNR